MAKALDLTFEERQALAAKAIRNVREKFSKDVMCAKTLDVYNGSGYRIPLAVMVEISSSNFPPLAISFRPWAIPSHSRPSSPRSSRAADHRATSRSRRSGDIR